MMRPYHKDFKIDREAFERVAKDVDDGIPLNFVMLHAIFGPHIFELVVLLIGHDNYTIQFGENKYKISDV